MGEEPHGPKQPIKNMQALFIIFLVALFLLLIFRQEFIKIIEDSNFRRKNKPEKEKDLSCPGCGGKEFYFGQEGGISINIQCTNCLKWYNYTLGFNKLEYLRQGTQ